jgi:hypothetical protein
MASRHNEDPQCVQRGNTNHCQVTIRVCFASLSAFRQHGSAYALGPVNQAI